MKATIELELFDIDSAVRQTDILPLQQNTIFQSLSGIHPNGVNDPNFLFIHQFMFGRPQFFQQALLLLLRESLTADDRVLFLAFAPE